MVMPHPHATRWTAAMLRALPDDRNRYEIIRGELFVTPAPTWRHQNAVLELAFLLVPYLRAHGIGHTIVAPADVEYSDDTVVEPDLFVVPFVDGRAPTEMEAGALLLLAVEVLSPSTARTDRLTKRELYLEQSVPEYWILDVDARLVERWRPGDTRPELVSETLDWRPDPAVPALAVDLPAYFARVRGEARIAER